MPRGGWRPGAGRKKGSKERRTRTAAERLVAAAERAIAASNDSAAPAAPTAPPILVSLTSAAAEAALPLDVMVTAMRAHLALARQGEEGIDLREMDKAAAIAKDAAPYIHPRLVSSSGTSDKETVIVIRGGLSEPPRGENAD